MKTSNRATPKYIPPRNREWKPKPHPRQSEFEQLPRPITMPGVGNGDERKHRYGSGR